jgi:ribose transport system substrate-binding protein
MRRRNFLKTSLAAGLPMLAACQRSDKRVIGVAPKGTSSVFWQSVQAGALAAGREFDVEIQWNGPPEETEFARQIQIVDSMINAQVDGIVLSPSESRALVGVVERAMSLGIPVTIFDSAIESDNYISYVATNNLEAGKMAAARVAELLSGSGQVAMVKHVPGSRSTGDREQGFEQALNEQYPGLKIVAQQFCISDRARALRVAEDMLTAHPGLNAMFCSSEAATIGAARAVRSRDAANRVKLFGFDSSPSQIQDLKDGIINSLVVQDPFQIGYLGVKTIVQKLDGETPLKQIDSPARIVTAADLEKPEIQKLLNPELEQYL